MTRFLKQKIWHNLFEAGIALKAINSVWETGAGLYLLSHLQHHGPLRAFIGIYLLFNGILNAFLAYNLFRNRLWAYKVMLGFTGLFVLYQTYKLLHTHALFLLGLTLFDIVFMVLTWHEYHYQSRRIPLLNRNIEETTL